MKAEAAVTGPISGSQALPHCFAASRDAVCHLPIFLSERSPSRWTCVRSLSRGTINETPISVALRTMESMAPPRGSAWPSVIFHGIGFAFWAKRTLSFAARLSASASSQIHSEPLPSNATTVAPAVALLTAIRWWDSSCERTISLGSETEGRQWTRKSGIEVRQIGAERRVNGALGHH